ncbi:MAG: hypothetical protein HYZ53_24200 [Planctomycetes bacterium]|nr:hypothetical protein [Planctomycetota bacterium]
MRACLPCIAVTVWALSIAGPARAQDKDAPATPPAPAVAAKQLTVLDGEYDDKAHRFMLVGESTLPDDWVVLGSVRFADRTGAFARGTIKGGKFQVAFDVAKKHPVMGKYVFRAEIRATDQPEDAQEKLASAGTAPPSDSKEVLLGSPADAERDLKAVKEKLAAMTEEFRRLFLQASERALYCLKAIEQKKEKNQGKLAEAEVEKYLGGWRQYAMDFWYPALRGMQATLKEYQELVFASPLPDVEADLVTISQSLEKLYFSYWSDICKDLGTEIPEAVRGQGEFFDRNSVEAHLFSSAAKIYVGLGLPDVVWQPVDPGLPEEGIVQGQTYSSKVAHFVVSKPNDDWVFEEKSADPIVRLKIHAKDPNVANRGWIQIEIKDFPDSEGKDDLKMLVEVMAHDRWAGYQKVNFKEFAIGDKLFPGGQRPGFDLLFRAEVNKVKFQTRNYELCCPSFKRTYAVIGTAYAEDWTKYEKDFDTIAKSFRVTIGEPKEPK